MRVAVTGASSPLGHALLRRLPNGLAVGRRMTVEPAALLIHAAAPDARDDESVAAFRGFNLAVAEWVDRWKPAVVNVGSWWQYANGPASQTAYVAEKDWQRDNLRDARTVIPYSIYSDRKGFPIELVDHISGRKRMVGLSTKPRDFIHVDDVAEACLRAADRLPGEYAACTGNAVVPARLGRGFGVNLPLYDPEPLADVTYPLVNIAKPTIHVADFIARQLADHVKRLTSQEG